MTIEIDTKGLIDALTRFAGPVMEKHVKGAAKVTADRVAQIASARAHRDTGETAESITVEEATVGEGYVVLPWDFGKTSRMPNLPIWLEFGTNKMTAKPYFFAAARMEEGAHGRRISNAIQDAIDEVGLGD